MNAILKLGAMTAIGALLATPVLAQNLEQGNGQYNGGQGWSANENGNQQQNGFQNPAYYSPQTNHGQWSRNQAYNGENYGQNNGIEQGYSEGYNQQSNNQSNWRGQGNWGNQQGMNNGQNNGGEQGYSEGYNHQSNNQSNWRGQGNWGNQQGMNNGQNWNANQGQWNRFGQNNGQNWNNGQNQSGQQFGHNGNWSNQSGQNQSWNGGNQGNPGNQTGWSGQNRMAEQGNGAYTTPQGWGFGSTVGYSGQTGYSNHYVPRGYQGGMPYASQNGRFQQSNGTPSERDYGMNNQGWNNGGNSMQGYESGEGTNAGMQNYVQGSHTGNRDTDMTGNSQ